MERKRGPKLSLKRKQLLQGGNPLSRDNAVKNFALNSKTIEPLTSVREGNEIELNDNHEVMNISSDSEDSTTTGLSVTEYQSSDKRLKCIGRPELTDKDSVKHLSKCHESASTNVAEETRDEDLFNLRQALLRIRKMTNTPKPDKLSELPPYQDTKDCSRDPSIKNGTWPQTDPVGITDLSPLPLMCEWCRRRRAPQSRYPILSEGVITDMLTEDVLDQKQQFSCSQQLSPNKKTKIDKSNSKLYTTDSGGNIPKTSSRKSKEEQVFNLMGKSREPVNHEKNFKIFDKEEISGGRSSKRVSSSSTESGINKSQQAHTPSAVPVPDFNESLGGSDQKNEDRISTCPMCGKVFDSRMSDLDRDGHLAACLSLAGDDVVW